MQEAIDGPSFGASPVSWSAAEEALQGNLEVGESVHASASALIRMALHLFDRCELLLTDRRLLLLKPSWPWGFRFERAFDLAPCSLIRAKQRMDGSLLLIVRTEAEKNLCFYIHRRSREGGQAILDALQSQSLRP